MRLLDKGYHGILETHLRLKTDLYSPDKETQKDLFDHCYAENKSIYLNDILKVNPNISYLDISTPSWHVEIAPSLYNFFMKYIDKIKGPSVNIFSSCLKKNGYNAILDYHDINLSWIQARNPLYLYQADNMVSIDNIVEINKFDIENSLEYIRDL